ncbi:hypothetical protein D3C80_1125960 [compost metagenome]
MFEHVAHYGGDIRNNHNRQDHPGSQNTDTERRAREQLTDNRNAGQHLANRGLEIFGKQRGEHEQAPHAINDTRDRRQQFNGDTQRAPQPVWCQLGQEQRNAEADGYGDNQCDQRGDDGTVDRYQGAKLLSRRVPFFGPQEGETEFLYARPGGEDQRNNNAAQQQ